jgi:uroporphyrinogen decarboxylase
MTPRETVLRTLSGEKTDRIPVALIGGGMWSVYHYGTTFEALSMDAGKMSDMIVAISRKLLSDIVYVGSGYPNFPVAAFGGKIKFRETGAPDLESPLVASEEDLQRLDITMLQRDAVITTLYRVLALTRARIGDEFVVTLTAWGPFTLGARFIGEEAMMKALFKRPEFVEKVLDFSVRVLMHFYEPVLTEGMLDVILLGEPTASGDLISKKQFERFVLSSIRKFTDWAKSKGAHTILHVCGNTTDRLDLFPLTGASCISLDHKTDMTKAKETLLEKMCFAGNIDPVKVLLQGTVREVEDACKRVIGAAGTEGHFIFMPGCDIPPTVPLENIRAFMRVAMEWRL